MKVNARKLRVAGVAMVLIGLYGCGGGGNEAPTDTSPPTPVPLNPPPALTYKPDAKVCAWMVEHIKPFVWPSQTWGPRTWQPAQIETVQTPLRDNQGLVQYQVTSSPVVLHAHYAPQIEAKGLAYSSGELWAQEASCKHGIGIDSQQYSSLSAYWLAYMPDTTAGRVALEEYTAGIKQVAMPDPCKPGPVFPEAPARPPGCTTPPQ